MPSPRHILGGPLRQRDSPNNQQQSYYRYDNTILSHRGIIRFDLDTRNT